METGNHLTEYLFCGRKKYLEETKERVQREWETNKAKSAVFQEEQQKRVQDFTNCFERLSDIEEKWKVFLYEKWKEEEVRDKWR